MDPVVIVGAGAAGLAAAAHLRRHGLETIIVEAARTVGGRARTTRPALLRGAWLDEGAAWLHAPDRNPVVPLARAAGIPLKEAFPERSRQLFTDGRRATSAEERAYEEAGTRWHDTIMTRAGEADRTLAEAAGAVRGDPWIANVETWEAAIIAAADADQLGVEDWHANELPGGDLMPRDGGLGAMLAALLPPDAGPVTLQAAVTHIDRTQAGHVLVHTGNGTLRASHVIVTVSTGVLRAETIRHTPPLPAATTDAIARLPMGLLSRLVLALDPATDDRLDFARGEEGLIERHLRPGEPAILFGAFPRGEPHVIGFHGGRTAWSLAADHDAANDFARTVLASLYGAARIARALAPGCHATDWGTDPHFLGAYAYAGAGDFPARAALAEPVDGGRLQFAGEATQSTGLAGTVGGAILSGRHAASIVLQARDKPPGARFTPRR